MAKDATLHVKVDREIASGLKYLAKDSGKSQGQLVREALAVCYQTGLSGLTLVQQQALAAYQGGYISMGKLARVMGMPALQLRQWLAEHSIPENNAFGSKDAANA